MLKNALRLNNGLSIPSLGLGTWEADSATVGDAVGYAIEEAGYKHIDCAAAYGNEKAIGKTLKNIFNKKTRREDVFVTSKLWNTEHAADRVEKACLKTLSDLKLEYLDLYIIHWGIPMKKGPMGMPIMKGGYVVFEDSPIHETWKAMEKLAKKKLVRSIGVSNFTPPMLLDLLTYAKIRPVTNQIEIHAYNSQEDYLKWLKHLDIVATAYSPLGRSGVRGIKVTPLLENRIVKSIARKHKKSPAQILINWGIARGEVVIPKSTSLARIKENAQVYDFSLDKKDTEAINALNKSLRLVDGQDYWGVPYFK